MKHPIFTGISGSVSLSANTKNSIRFVTVPSPPVTQNLKILRQFSLINEVNLIMLSVPYFPYF
jgi:hypothetical protein